MKIHNFLEKPINRAIILLTPLVSIIALLTSALIYILVSSKQPSINFWYIYLFSVAWFVISLFIVIWSDRVRHRKYNEDIDDDEI